MHDQRVGFGIGKFGPIQTMEMEIFTHGRDKAAFHAFKLKPQHHDDIAIFQAFFHVMENLDSHPFDLGWDKGRWCDKAYARSHGIEQQYVGSCDA